MLLNTRRRMLGLLAAAIGAPRLVQLVPLASAAETEEKRAAKKSECFALQPFGDWKGVATNTQAGARIGQISFADSDSCDLRGEISVAESYDAKLVLYGDPDTTPLPKDFLTKPDNRIIAKGDDGSTGVDEPLCGVCTDIRDDKVSIVLPLATRVALPSWIGLALGVMKDSVLVFIVQVVELLKSTQILITRLQEPLFLLTICGLFYFLISFPVARFGGYQEKRWSND